MGKWYEIWRAGKYPQGEFTEEDVQQIVDNYDPKREEAPIVLGHPKNNDPAFGWVEALARKGPLLLAKFKQVVPEFAEAVNAGRYKKVSVRLAKDEKKGWMLKHVGFLGAALPQVQGLAPITFSGDDGGMDLECDFDGGTGKNHHEEVKQMGDKEKEALKEQIRQEMEAEFAEKSKTLEQRLAESEAKRKKAEFTAFMEKHKAKIPPAVQPGLVEFMTSLPDKEDTVEFTAKEGDKEKQVKQSPLAFFQDFISKLPDYSPLFKEIASGEDGKTRREEKDFAGVQVDEERMELHRKALDFMEKNKVSYEEALIAVSD